ncbi:polysaccharide deacetylase family protein [Pontibacter ruber]|uniref:Polysaccharide deacetylase family protein n=1 Tax=Pontibacter ruber TaxID=1343895 RepID=A0ABW5CTV0_9BACT|nr:polysaccharide deacetylase family protein [Pontibacter ruber]
MKTSIRKAIHQVDVLLAPFMLSAFKEQNAFTSFLFHALFQNKEELALNLADPQQQVTVDVFRRFVEYHLEKGYTFVSPTDVLKGLDPDKKSILITFDDGYYNNLRALPVMEEFQVPALFFISANHVLKGKAFWWDVVYREGKKAGRSDEAILEEKAHLLTLTDEEVDKHLIRTYGEHCLKPVSDTDRPLTSAELRTFSEHPLVYIGNHTCDHAVLTNYTSAGMREQIAQAQDILEDMIGYRPASIAYPCGEYNEDVLRATQEEGIVLGITTNHAKNAYPSLSDPKTMLTLNRFTIWGTEDLQGQCDFYRSDYHLLDSMRGIYHKLKPSAKV